MKLTYLFAMLLLPVLAVGQDCTMEQYQKFLKEADAASQKGDFKLAISKLNSAKTCKPTKGEEVDKKILAVFDEVNQQREKAVQNEKEAKRQKELAQKNAKEADAQRKKVEVQRDSTVAQRKLADQEKSNALRQSRAAGNIALVSIARDTNPTFALQSAYYNWQAHPDNTNAAVAFAQLYGDTILGFYHEVKKYHRGYVFKLAFVGGGKKLYSAGENCDISIRDVATGAVSSLFGVGAMSTNGVAIAPDGKSVVMGVFMNDPFLWNEKRGYVGIPDADGKAGGMAFSSDGSLFAIGGADGSVLVFSNPEVKLKHRLAGHRGGISALAFSADGSRLLSGSTDRSLILWDLHSEKVLQKMTGHQNHPTTVAFSPDGKQAASGSHDTTVKIWDLSSGQLLTTMDAHHHPVVEVAYAPNGAYLLTASGDGQAILWDANTFKMKLRCIGHGGPITAIAFTPDSKMFYTGGRDGAIRSWHIERNTLLRTYDQVVDACFSPDGKEILLGNRRGAATICQVETDSVLRSFNAYSKSPVAFTPDKKQVWIGISLWDMATTKEVRSLATSSTQDVVISPDGKTVLKSAEFDPETLVELATQKVLHTFEEHSEHAMAIDFSADAANILLAGAGGVTVWNVANAKTVFQRRSLPGAVWGARFSPDGRTIVVGLDGGGLQLLNATTGETVQQFPNQPYMVYDVDFAPDGKSIAAVNGEGNIIVWDIMSGLPLQVLSGFKHNTRKIKWSPDGNLLLTIDQELENKNIVRLWRTHLWTLQQQIHQFSLTQLREKGLQLEPEALLQLWETKVALTPDELKLVGKTANKP